MIIPADDKTVSASFLAELLGLDPPQPSGPAMVVVDGNGLRMAYVDASPVGDRHGAGQLHYAFAVSESEFDAIFARITERAIPFWADSKHEQQGVINDHWNGRGLFFDDPSGHNMELLTGAG